MAPRRLAPFAAARFGAVAEEEALCPGARSKATVSGSAAAPSFQVRRASPSAALAQRKASSSSHELLPVLSAILLVPNALAPIPCRGPPSYAMYAYRAPNDRRGPRLREEALYADAEGLARFEAALFGKTSDARFPYQGALIAIILRDIRRKSSVGIGLRAEYLPVAAPGAPGPV